MTKQNATRQGPQSNLKGSICKLRVYYIPMQKAIAPGSSPQTLQPLTSPHARARLDKLRGHPLGSTIHL